MRAVVHVDHRRPGTNVHNHILGGLFTRSTGSPDIAEASTIIQPLLTVHGTRLIYCAMRELTSRMRGSITRPDEMPQGAVNGT